jgi:hypothetical protein
MENSTMPTFDDLISAFVELCRAEEYSDDQKRADDGKWADEGGGGGGDHKTKIAVMKRAQKLGYRDVSFGKDGQVIANGKKLKIWVKDGAVVGKNGQPHMAFKNMGDDGS